jgi:hypothetical protein
MSVDFDKDAEIYVVSTDGFAKLPLYCPKCKIHIGEVRIQHDVITIDNIEFTCRVCGTRGHGKDLWAESIDIKEKRASHENYPTSAHTSERSAKSNNAL